MLVSASTANRPDVLEENLRNYAMGKVIADAIGGGEGGKVVEID